MKYYKILQKILKISPKNMYVIVEKFINTILVYIIIKKKCNNLKGNDILINEDKID